MPFRYNQRMTKSWLALFILCAPLSAHADEKCTIATKGDSLIAKACQSGGRKEASAVMKGLVKTAKANGTEFKCVACHEDLDGFVLVPTARDDFKKLLAAQKK
jgi:hypothetical protein